MIIPTLWIKRQSTGGNDVHGQPVLGPMTSEKVAPVKLIFSTQHTTVRTDSAGSHGHAYEGVANVVLLALPTSKIAIDDVLTVLDHKVRVVAKHSRYQVTGILDHFEVNCLMWR